MGQVPELSKDHTGVPGDTMKRVKQDMVIPHRTVDDSDLDIQVATYQSRLENTIRGVIITDIVDESHGYEVRFRALIPENSSEELVKAVMGRVTYQLHEELINGL